MQFDFNLKLIGQLISYYGSVSVLVGLILQKEKLYKHRLSQLRKIREAGLSEINNIVIYARGRPFIDRETWKSLQTLIFLGWKLQKDFQLRIFLFFFFFVGNRHAGRRFCRVIISRICNVRPGQRVTKQRKK